MAEQSKIMESVKKRILAEMASEDYEQAEIIVRCNTTSKGKVKIKANRYLIVDGKKSHLQKALNHQEYRELFARHHGLTILQFMIDGQEIKAFGNYSSTRDNYGVIEAFNAPETFLETQVNPYLESGVAYTAAFYLDELSYFNINPFYAYYNEARTPIKNKDLRQVMQADPMFLAILQFVVANCAPISKIKVTFRKDQPVEIVRAKADTIIADILAYYNLDYGQNCIINCNISYENEAYNTTHLKVKCNGKLTLNGKIEALEKFPKDDFIMLYLYLERKIDQLTLTIKNGALSIAANHTFPAYDIRLIKTQQYDIAEDDVAKICEFIESGDEEKIIAAIEAACQLESTQDKIEQRYLSYIKAQCLNQSATLQDIRPEMFADNMQNICLGKHAMITKDYIYFGLKNEEETKQVIDFIGTLVSKYVDIQQFIQAIETTFVSPNQSPQQLQKQTSIYNKYRQQLIVGLEKEAQLYANGWWSKACLALSNIKVNKVMIDNARFFKQERLPYLMEYMFFLNVSSNGDRIHIDISDSQMHDLTKLYWMFSSIPSITWFQTQFTYTPYPFIPELEVLHRVDNGGFQQLELAKYRVSNHS
ncbi:MAG TPA: hypothetical protein DCS93_24890 [Microscillaceae bacterium]|nr:hypothetical protein [Microscillaceae bacterium]